MIDTFFRDSYCHNCRSHKTPRSMIFLLLYKNRQKLTSSTTGSTYISRVLLRGGSGIGSGDAAADDRLETLLHEHCETERRERGDSLRTRGYSQLDR